MLHIIMPQDVPNLMGKYMKINVTLYQKILKVVNVDVKNIVMNMGMVH